MSRLLAAVAAFVLMLTVGARPDAAARQVTGIAEQRKVDIEDGQPLALSPDGRWLAVWHRDAREVCAYATDDLAPDTCAAFPGASLDPESVTWSPDGTRFAFTEDGLRYFDETDVWVVAIDGGTVTNLTDDGKEGGDITVVAGANVPLDFAPAWSPDGTALVFARSIRLEEEDEDGDELEETTLYRIAAAGGAPTPIVTVAGERYAVVAGTRWLADDTILFAVEPSMSSRDAGIWAVAAAGGQPRQVLRDGEHDLIHPHVVDVSPAGQVLVMSLYETRRFALLDPARGAVEVVEPAAPDLRALAGAAFSPDGSRLLIAYATADGPRLLVHDLATGEERDLGELAWPLGAAIYQAGLTWAINDLAYGPGAAEIGLLIRLEVE